MTRGATAPACSSWKQPRVPRKAVTGWQTVADVRQELRQLLGKIVRRGLTAIALQHPGGQWIAARGPADRQVDPAGYRPLSMLNVSATFNGL